MKNAIAFFLRRYALPAVLTWTASAGQVDGYRIYRAESISTPFALIGTGAGNLTTFTDAAGAAGHCWRVTAFNSAGESQASNNACLLLVIPTAPQLSAKP